MQSGVVAFLQAGEVFKRGSIAIPFAEEPSSMTANY